MVEGILNRTKAAGQDRFGNTTATKNQLIQIILWL